MTSTEPNKMERKRTFTMDWSALRDQDDDCFFESRERVSSAVPIDLQASSSDEDDDDNFDDSRMSFASSVRKDLDVVRAISAASASTAETPPSFMSHPFMPDYNIWTDAPGSISERRRRLRQGMGLADNDRDIVSFKRIVSIKQTAAADGSVAPQAVTKSPTLSVERIEITQSPPAKETEAASPKETT